ncbi:phenylalanine 4-monooxygenase [Sphingomonas swuensis]|uniref:Phenylalanine 4-monooxygenase n=1 Tax=Sphingomonas swuensis TaxID=977800 RepID=A0ABP7TC84_9SPHN
MFKDFTDPNRAEQDGWRGYVVDQGWAGFNAEEHETWDILYQRQTKLLEGRIVSPFFDGLAALGLGEGGIPELMGLNRRLHPLTGWRCVAVAGLVPDAAFFAMLAQRVFPIGNFIRSRAQLDYLEEPDCFHDIYGHVPMLAHRGLADAMARFAAEGCRAIAAGRGDAVARLYWHTVEFGLAREEGELRILGAGLASSFGEAAKSLEDPGIERRRFTVEAAAATPYRHDAMQPLYLVADSLDEAVEALATAAL